MSSVIDIEGIGEIYSQKLHELVRIVPGPEQVADWVKQAHKLPRVVSY